MIIVEGCDNSGKTTLVSALSGDLRLLSIVNRQRPLSLQDSYAYLTRVLPLALRFATIFDRWQPISEPIYGPICRGVHLFNDAHIQNQFRMTKNMALQPLVIYCRPSIEKIMDFGEREQMAGVIENAPAIVAAYDHQIEWLKQHFPVVRYDFERDTYDHIKQVALEHLQSTGMKK